jgi:hypothetical protein
MAQVPEEPELTLSEESRTLLVVLHKQARLLSKQFLHKSAISISASALSLTHPLSSPACPLVGYYLEA